MIDAALLLRFALALGGVLAMIAAAAWLARRYYAPLGPARPGGRRRLGIVESLAVDSRCRLLLVQRDGAEHLLLIGPSGALVVERAIRRDGLPPASGASEAQP